MPFPADAVRSLPAARGAADIALTGLETIHVELKPGCLPATCTAWQQTMDDGVGHSRYRRHHCGHGVGIGFPPAGSAAPPSWGCARASDFVLREALFHNVSWLVGEQPGDLPGDYCVSDTALVTADGCELLITTPRHPVVA